MCFDKLEYFKGDNKKMKADNCIFCKIAAGEIPSGTLYEDDDFRVILDRGPATKGHALILPKEHFKDIYEIAKLIVDDFDANKLKNINDDDHLKLVNKVQEQAANDGINVTDSVAGGAVKKAVQEKQAKA